MHADIDACMFLIAGCLSGHFVTGPPHPGTSEWLVLAPEQHGVLKALSGCPPKYRGTESLACERRQP
jgi:hypothetical protein